MQYDPRWEREFSRDLTAKMQKAIDGIRKGQSVATTKMAVKRALHRIGVELPDKTLTEISKQLSAGNDVQMQDGKRRG